MTVNLPPPPRWPRWAAALAFAVGIGVFVFGHAPAWPQSAALPPGAAAPSSLPAAVLLVVGGLALWVAGQPQPWPGLRRTLQLGLGSLVLLPLVGIIPIDRFAWCPAVPEGVAEAGAAFALLLVLRPQVPRRQGTLAQVCALIPALIALRALLEFSLDSSPAPALLAPPAALALLLLAGGIFFVRPAPGTWAGFLQGGGVGPRITRRLLFAGLLLPLLGLAGRRLVVAAGYPLAAQLGLLAWVQMIVLGGLAGIVGWVLHRSECRRDQAEKERTDALRQVERQAAILQTEVARRTSELTRALQFNQRLALVASRTTNGVLIANPAGRIEWVNAGFTRITGHGFEDVLGRKPGHLLQGKRTDPATVAMIRERLAAGRGFEAELLNYHRDGYEYWAAVEVQPLRDAAGKLIGFMGIQSDITARKLAEEILRRNEALFSALIEQAPVGVYVVDAQLRVQQVNSRARPAFGKGRPPLGRELAHVLRVIWPKRTAEEITNHFRHTLQTGKPYLSPDFSERRRDLGQTEFYEWQLQRVTLPAGEHGVVCFFNNITARKHAEEVQRSLAVLTASNQKLEREIIQRQAVEATLKQSEQHQRELLEQSRHMEGQLRHLSRQMLQVQEEERKRISRELHDVIAQTLTGINVRLATLKKGAGLNRSHFEQDLEGTQRLVENSVNIVHQFARELRPAVLDDLGLIPALHAFLKDFTARTGVHTHLVAFAGLEQLELDRRTILFRVAQEALTNVARHARASRVEVKMEKLATGVRMKISDNGQAFNVQAKGSKRLGLLGMRERLEMVGGRFEIEPVPGQGTTVIAEMPWGKREKKRR